MLSPTTYIAIVEPGYGSKPSPTIAPVTQPTQSPVPGTATPSPTPPQLPVTGTSSLIPLWIIAGVVLVVSGAWLVAWATKRHRRDRDEQQPRRHGL